ncbi:hypothetical protein J2X11_000701 [Aeromicrobium panaciterrae]|uniref:Transposase n=1 Tax=Aeromicrobium panaciterrae TaxID=363861 RepID=A0ABU1UKZ6_9ACTN|nr:hypothetical protein [Aeromicrobium panaciterrae]MDR7085862.1 hypothetical protein [Aeromicrobium panaciterrae]
MHDSLPEIVRHSHRTFADEIDASAHSTYGKARTGDLVQKADAFLIHACRHVSSVCAVVLPTARRRLPDGKQRVKEYVHQLRRLERAIAQAKGRLYGQSRSVHLPWAGVWAQLCSEFRELMALEHRLIGDLAVAVGPRLGGRIASRLLSAEASGLTRPHPNSPHTGPLSGIVRRIWMRADTFWDLAENRIVLKAVN